MGRYPGVSPGQQLGARATRLRAVASHNARWLNLGCNGL